MTIPYFIRGSIFILPLIPSVFVAIFNLYHLLTKQALRKALNNHVIILLLIAGLIESFTDIIWQIYSYRNNMVLVQTRAFCLVWTFLSAATYIIIFILMAWASMERHILVFYPNWLRTKNGRLYLHYIPLAVCVLYPTIFYFTMVIALPCKVTANYIYRDCALYTCINSLPWMALWDSIGNYILPSFVTVFFSFALFIRVLYKRYRARGQIDWRNYKKMTAQLLPISFLYMAMQLPAMILYAAYSAGAPYSLGQYYYSDGLYFIYWVPLLTPFATVLSLPDLKTKCRDLLFWRKNRVVQPVAIEMARRNVNQSGATGMTRPKANQPTAMETVPPKVNQPATAEVTPLNVNQPTAIEMIPSKANQQTANEMIPSNTNQPTATKMIPSNDNQTTANEMVLSDVNEPTDTEIVSPNAHKPTGAVTIHRYLDQPASVLPDVN